VTKIQWTNETWNPVVGCSIVSPGCTNCYAMRDAHRRLDGTMKDGRLIAPQYAGTTKIVNGNPVWTGKIGIASEKTRMKPLHWTRPRMIFVNSMGDLFHEDIPDEVIDWVFSVIGRARQHTFQILTKRSARMRAYMTELARSGRWMTWRWEDRGGYIWDVSVAKFDRAFAHVWCGVSAEDQRRADERIPDLLATPATVRFVSAEPLLGPVDFTRLDLPGYGYLNALDDGFFTDGRAPRRRLDWIIVGGESGPNARQMALGWAKNIVRQCKAAGVPVFVKQLGAHPTNREGERCPHIKARKGDDMAEWPEELRVREMPAQREMAA